MVTSLAIPGAVDGDVFQHWLRTDLVPRLAPGTTIVLDNLNVHKSPIVRDLVARAHCHLRYLPPYSPDFNPIELAFSRLKTHLRGVKARTFAALVDAIGASFNSVSAEHAAAWYRHCGYHLPPTDPEQPL